jgi:PAS domain S-box-containing protein
MAQIERNPQEARTDLYDVMRSDAPFDEKARQALEIGRQYLGADNGHLTQIDTDVGHWEATISTDPPDGQFPPGLELDLEKTYCRRTIEADKPLTVHNAPAQGWADDPAFETHGLHCYHGTTLRVDNGLSGTVCFVAEDPCEDPFTAEETMFAELVTRLLEQELERDHHEAELTRQANLVNVLNRVLRHNLRNDLSVVRGHAQLMMEQADVETHGEICLRAVDELIDLTRKARELDRIVGEDLDRQETDIVALVERVLGDIAPEFPDASFTVEHEGTVTAAVRPNFKRAVKELVENAAKHGGDAPAVTITIERVPNAVDVHIADDGPGLDEQEREVLESGVETPLIHGSGLGLWLVHWIVSDHDGDTNTETTNEGTSMTISVPRSPEVETQPQVAELREPRDRYQAAFEKAFEGMFILNDDARIVAANPEAATIYGTGRQELLGRSLPEFLPGEFDFEDAWAEFKAAGTERDTVTYIRSDGVERPVEYTATADIVPGQHLIAFRDITDRKQREQQLQQERERFERLLETSPAAITVLDRTGTIVRANDRAEEVLGLNKSEITSRNYDDPEWEIVDAAGDPLPSEKLPFRQVIETGRPVYGYEHGIRRPDGTLRWLSVNAAPLTTGGGEIERVIAVITDRTEQYEEE